MEKFPMDWARWQSGLTLDAFVAGMTTHQAGMRRRLRQVELPPADRDDFAQIESTVHVLVMTEDWCGDSLMNLPILAHVVQAAPGMDLRIFIRPRSPELDADYTARGITHIPVVSFLDADFGEIGTWVERSQAAHAAIGEWMAAHPEVTKLMADAELSAEARHHLLQEKFGGMLREMEAWYADGLQAETVDELRALLAPVATTRPLRPIANRGMGRLPVV